jgi:apolipoprotein N-acyltransferase
VSLVPRDFGGGSEPGVFDVHGVRFGDVICFEVAYDSLVADTVRAGAQFLVVQTNNATFGRSSESAQQLAMVRLRAVEYGRPAVMASTTGVSAFVTPTGELSQVSEVFTREVLVGEIVPSQARTVASIVGQWPEWLLAGLVLLAAMAGSLGARAAPQSSQSSTRETVNSGRAA